MEVAGIQDWQTEGFSSKLGSDRQHLIFKKLDDDRKHRSKRSTTSLFWKC